jgi:DNA-binding transcriptional regulator YiaG
MAVDHALTVLTTWLLPGLPAVESAAPVSPVAFLEGVVEQTKADLERAFVTYSRLFADYAAEGGGNLPVPSGTVPHKHKQHPGCLCGATPLERAAAILDWTARPACQALFAREKRRDPERYAELRRRTRVKEWHTALVDPVKAERLTEGFRDASLDAYSTGDRIVSAVRAHQGLDYGNPDDDDDDDVPVGRQTWGGVASPDRAYRALELSRNLDGRNADYIDAAALVDATLWDMPDWWARVVAAKKSHKAKRGRECLEDAGFASLPAVYTAADLSDTERRGLELRYLEGQRYESIAEELQETVVAARVQVFRALAKIREVLVPKSVTESLPIVEGKVLRERAGLTTRELAARVGVAHSTITRWENQTRRPRDTEAARRYLAVLAAWGDTLADRLEAG